MQTPIRRTEKARLELAPGVRTLGLRERALLLLADGRPLADLKALYEGAGGPIVDRLLHQGYLARADAPRETPVPSEPHPPARASGGPPTPPAAAPGIPAPAAGAPRSLAGTRMYLFDICERLFARRDPDLARRFHGMLRDARDRAGMLDAADALLAEVARQAGSERAQDIRDRMNQFLPREAAGAAPAD